MLALVAIAGHHEGLELPPVRSWDKSQAPSDSLTYRRYINNCIYLSIYLNLVIRGERVKTPAEAEEIFVSHINVQWIYFHCST